MRNERTMRWQSWLWLWLPVVVWMGVIFAFSSMTMLPSLPGSTADLLLKKGAHVTEYAVLGLLLLRACRGSLGVASPLLPSLTTIIIGGLYAASDEFHQSFVPTRTPALRDVAIDVIAVIAAVALVWLRQQRRQGQS